MLHANIRSTLKNLASLEKYINNLDHNLTQIGISEPWFKEHNVDRYGIEGCNGVDTFRPIRSGGVSIFVQNSITFFCANRPLLSEYSYGKFFNYINKEQIGKDKTVTIGAIYRPPDTDIKVFNEYISELLDRIRSKNICVACLGNHIIHICWTRIALDQLKRFRLNVFILSFPMYFETYSGKLQIWLIIHSVIILSIIKMYLLEFCIRISHTISRYFILIQQPIIKILLSTSKSAYILKKAWDFYLIYFQTKTGLMYYRVKIPRMRSNSFQIVIGVPMINVSHPGL